MQTKAATVSGYLAALPEDRRRTLESVRNVIRANLPKGYAEMMNFGAITYAVPLETLPDTYNNQPLCYIALAAQKNYNALYLMTAYGDPATAARLKKAFKDAGKKLDMGKSCVRFQTADDLPLESIGDIVASTPIEKYVMIYRQSRERPTKGKASKRKK